MGTAWESEEGKNLTFSILKTFSVLRASDQFKLNICVSLAICDVLEELSIPGLKIKWPNDIMSGSFKVCGILIENILTGRFIKNAIIGIGLNVNQDSFKMLDRAASLRSITGQEYDLDRLLRNVMGRLQLRLRGIGRRTHGAMLRDYGKLLFRKDMPSTFKNEGGEFFMGFVRGVSPLGKLILELENNVMKEFSLKEVSLLY